MATSRDEDKIKLQTAEQDYQLRTEANPTMAEVCDLEALNFFIHRVEQVKRWGGKKPCLKVMYTIPVVRHGEPTEDLYDFGIGANTIGLWLRALRQNLYGIAVDAKP